MLTDLYRSYLLKNLYGDVSKFVRKNMKNIDFDRDRWLHKAGVTSYHPGRAFLGGISLFTLGAIAGGIAALAFAPKPGHKLRAEVADKARELIAKTQEKVERETSARA